MKKKEYKKIASGRRLMSSVQLWQGKDHLLVCESMGYSEDYKRFFFRDIQAVMVRDNFRRMVWSFVWGGFLLFFLVLMGFFQSEPALWFCAGFFGILFLINLLMGKGCICHLKTAVQRVEIPVVRKPK